jgi:hypothetical protein
LFSKRQQEKKLQLIKKATGKAVSKVMIGGNSTFAYFKKKEDLYDVLKIRKLNVAWSETRIYAAKDHRSNLDQEKTYLEFF